MKNQRVTPNDEQNSKGERGAEGEDYRDGIKLKAKRSGTHKYRS